MRDELIATAVNRLPAFNPHWSGEMVDRWFAWFFQLLDALIEPKAEPRQETVLLLPDLSNQPPAQSRAI